MSNNLPLPLEVWVLERLENCERIAATKPAGGDRDGWLEDATYFRMILTRLTIRAIGSGVCMSCVYGGCEPCADCLGTGWEKGQSPKVRAEAAEAERDYQFEEKQTEFARAEAAEAEIKQLKSIIHPETSSMNLDLENDALRRRCEIAEARVREVEAERGAIKEMILRTRRRLEAYCNLANAGRMPGDAREFMRCVQCGFDALFEETQCVTAEKERDAIEAATIERCAQVLNESSFWKMPEVQCLRDAIRALGKGSAS